MSITYGLHRALLLNRNGTAVMFEDRRRTFAELADRVARLAGALRNLGIAKGDRVAVLSLNQDRYIELYLGVAWAGAVIVPLNIRWSAMENEDAVRDCRPKVLVVDAAFAAVGAEIAKKIGSFEVIYADDAPMKGLPSSTPDYERLLAAAAPIPDADSPDKELAGIFYTGGTTGRSKGVMLSHHNLMSNARNMAAELNYDETSIYLHVAPMFHLADGAALFGYLLKGATHAVLRMFTPEGVAQAIERFRITDVLLVPTMIQMFVDHPGVENYDLSSLTPGHLRRFADQRGGDGSGDGQTSKCRICAGLRHDRTFALRDLSALEGSYRRGTRQGAPPIGWTPVPYGRRTDRRRRR